MIWRTIRAGWRQLALFAALLAFSTDIAYHLYTVQVAEQAGIARAASTIYDSQAIVPASRGGIVDANGAWLVTDTDAYVVAVDPQDTPHPRYNAAKLARILHRDPGQLLARITLPKRRYVIIANLVDQTTANAIRALGLPGVMLSPARRAVYPQGSLASSVLGFVNLNNNGQYGLEQFFDRKLQGRDGSKFIFVDTANRTLPVGTPKPRPAIPGATLQLTIDTRIQTIVERRLAAAIKRYGALSGTAIVMDPHSGAILAMASLPSYDPNHYNRVPNDSLFQDLAIQSYQPGSTFKIISVAAGLDSGAFTPGTQVYDPGFYSNYGITVHNWDKGPGWGWETPEIMLRHSANVGMAQFANMMRPTTFYHYVTDQFGFNSPTGIHLAGESPGYVRTPTNGLPWQMMDLLTNSYGQGINVTPLQLTTAVAALANGGWRMKPYIVKSITYPSEDNIPPVIARPQRVVQAVSAATAQTMTGLLQHSAENGEATCALTKDYAAAAKTGTATIEGPVAHGLDYTQGTVASLIGYAPVSDPKFVMLVTINHPKPGYNNNNIWGSVVAAPAWHDIAMALYRVMGIVPQAGSTPAQLDQWQGSGPGGWACAFDPQ